MRSTTEQNPSKHILDFRAYEAAPGISVIVHPNPPYYTYVAVSNDFLKASGKNKEEVIGKSHFDVFPKSPDDLYATGEQNLRASFDYILQHKKPHEISVQRYDTVSADGSFSLRFWKVSNAPILSDEGEVLYIIHSVVDITEKIKAQQGLESSKGIEKAYNFFMNAPVIIGFIRGEEYVIELANEGLLEVWGRTDSVVGQPLFQAIPELAGQGFKFLLDEVMATGEPFYAFEYPISLVRHGKEEVLYFDFVYKPFYENTAGSASGIISVGLDVTEKVLAKQQVAESEKRYRTLFNSMDQGFCIIEMLFDEHNTAVDYRFVETNPVFEKQAGLKNAVGKTMRELASDMEQRWFETYGYVAKTGEPVRFTQEAKALQKWFDVYAFRMAGSETNQVAVLFTDITEKKKWEESLRNHSALIHAIANNATSTLFMMDQDGMCTFINSTGEKMLGYTAEEFKERPMHELVHHHRPDGSFYPREECLLEKAMRDGVTIKAHKELFFRKDGSSFPALCSASPLMSNGEIVSAVIEVRDITLEIAAEQALRNNAIELEHKVQERTEELRMTNEQLKQFAYAASHDLQEPLRKINFFLDRLLNNIGASLSEDNRQLAQRIVTTTGRMRSLIDDLLNYSNTTLGATMFGEVDLMTVVKDVLSDMEATTIEKNAAISLQQLPQVKGDPRQLRQLFQNLIGNALKYHKKGETPKVQISSSIIRGEQADTSIPIEKKTNIFYEISIKDNGIGFDQDDAERIFRLFHRLHGKAEYEGTGVGLAIVQKVVENHHGFISAEGKPNEGATFKLLLPVGQ